MEGKFIVAATGCPTGIAHTYMAEAALKKAADARGIEIRVETHGQVGLGNGLSAEEISRATGVIIAADKDVQAARFAGKPIVEVGVKAGIHDADKLIDQVLTKAEAHEAVDASVSADEPPGENDILDVETIQGTSGQGWRPAGRAVYKHLMNGVSHMLPFVVGGGVLIATSFLFGIYSADPENAQYNPFAGFLMTLGHVGLGLMVPVLSAFIAASISTRPGMTVGLITGMLANSMGTGFLGGIVTGFMSGYGMLLLATILDRMPKAMAGLKAIFLYPVLGTFAFGGITYLIAAPMASISKSLESSLASFQYGNPVLLGLIIGVMCAFDMGGPVNKAAYVTGVALLAQGNLEFMAAVSAACIAPPLATALAVTVFPRGFEPGERRAGYVNYALGATHITEGAIPFAARNPLVVIPILMVSSSIAAILTLLWGVRTPAPHGGFIVLPVVGNALQWVIAILLGAGVGGALFGLYRTREARKATASSRDGEMKGHTD